MKLHLVVQNLEVLDNGLPARLSLGEHGAIIGRSATVDWCLPDAKNFISSRHCEITFKTGDYYLADTSTNGTFVNGRQMSAPHKLTNRDLIVIGHYQICAEIEGASEANAHQDGQNGSGGASQQAWAAWDMAPPSSSAPSSAPSSGWDSPSSSSNAAISGQGPMSSHWAAPALGGAPSAPPPAPVTHNAADWGPAPQAGTHQSAVSGGSTASQASPWGAPLDHADTPPASSGSSPWDMGPATPEPQASPWSSPITDKPASNQGSDIWGQISEGYVVDWARGGFGASAKPVELNSLPISPMASSAPPAQTSSWDPVQPSTTAFTPESDKTSSLSSPPLSVPRNDQIQDAQPPALASLGYARFTQALGLDPAALSLPQDETLMISATLLRRLVAGMVVMLEARARAKSQMGAQSTSLQFDGNNPMKFARTPEQALMQLLNPKAKGFMEAERAIEDAFLDLQSHQMATLKAMQGALKATLERFSPSEIKKRVDSKGLMAKLFTDARDAALWKAYEKEFSGVVDGSDEAFMDVFSKEFRKAYDEQTSKKGF